MKKITEGILNKNYVQAKDAFYEEVDRRINEKIEEKRIQILSEKKWKHSGLAGTIGGIAGTVAGAGTLNPALAVAGGAAGLAAGEAGEYAAKKVGRFVKNKYLRRKRKKAQALKVKNNGR
jgi:outer membrane lipoprotein SlyB